MSRTTRRSSSIYELGIKRKETNDLIPTKPQLSNSQITIGILIGGILTLLTIVIHCIAYFTPHWKEITPNTHSVYVDGVDALIRTEILVYFNSVHRFTRHSYGLFQRCEHSFGNLTKIIPDRSENSNNHLDSDFKRCTKNFIPLYTDAKFNKCHSLQYYRFCSKTSGKIFDIGNDYLRATFDITIDAIRNTALTSTCSCYYPEYVSACHILGIIALICLVIMVFVYGAFPFLKTRHQGLKYKCLGILSWILSVIFMLANISVVLSYIEYESLEYVTAIERHYRSSQIFTLSQDAKTAIQRFRSSINIDTGYSTKLAWLALFLSIIDGILMIFTYKIKSARDDMALKFLVASNPNKFSRSNSQNENTDQDSTLGVFLPVETPPASSPVPSLSPLTPAVTTIVTNDLNEQSKRPLTPPRSCLKRTSVSHVCFQEEV